MEMETIALILNAILLTLVIGGTVLLLWKLKLGSKNKVLLFILFILYWMAPLMCREYTGQMHIHQPNYDDGTLLWIPLTVYGFAGLLWRPLTDVISYRMRSRKNVIYISLVIQMLTLWPMFAWPESFACNIIQSIGTGVGASGIGLFNLMFTEQEHHRKVFTTVSILALPPLIAEFITSCIEAILCGLVPEHGLPTDTPPITIYLDKLKYLWLIAIVFVLASFIITFFIKEEKQTLFKKQAYRETIQNQHHGWVLVLVCFVGICFTFIRWITAGPSSVTQLIYIAVGQWEYSGANTWLPTALIEEVKFFEGYLSCMFAFGQLAGAVIAGLLLNKHENRIKPILIASGAFVWLIYLVVNTQVISVHLYFWSNILNGLGYGLIYPVLIGIVLRKHFNKTNIVTPIGLFNTSMALGIIGGSIFNNVIKGSIYDFHYVPMSSTIEYFDSANILVNYVTCGVVLLMVSLFVIAYFINLKHPARTRNVKIEFSTASEMEI